MQAAASQRPAAGSGRGRLRPPLRAALALSASLLPGAARADLDLVIDAFSVAKPEIAVFDAFQVSATVRNAGSEAAEDAVVSFGHSLRTGTTTPQEIVREQEVTVDLAPGQSLGLTFSASLSPGEYNLILDLDPDSQIAESNETNNFASVPVTVKGIEITPGMLEAFRDRSGVLRPGEILGPFVLLQPVSADLSPGLNAFYFMGSNTVGHVGARVTNAGPDRVPEALLDRISVVVEFVGAQTDKACAASLAGRWKGGMPANATVFVDFYTESTLACPRAKVVQQPCDPPAAAEGKLSFPCLVLPELRLSLDLPATPDLAGSGLYLVDPKPFNNVEIVPPGLH